MEKILIFSLLFFGTITTNATLYLSKSDIKTSTDKGYILSENYGDYNTCNSTKNINNEKYTSYERSECFSSDNGYNYFICESSTDCSISGKTSSVNEMTINLDIPNKNALDKFLVKVKNLSADMTSTDYKNKLIFMSNKLNSLKNSYSNNIQITKMLEYLITGINKIKIDYEKNNDINNFFNDIYSDTTIKTSTNSTINTTSSGTTGTISSTASTCNFDECLSNGFYVIKSTNTKYPEGCNSEGLKTPENLCILKIKDMYVAPKNFTSIASKGNYVLINSSSGNFQVKKALVNDQRLKILPNSIIYDLSINDACNTALKSLNEKDYSSSDEYTKARNNVRNSSVCITYDKYLSSVAGKTKLSENFACSDLSTFIGNSIKWKQLEELGGDGDSYSCDENTSNKNGLCLIELNRSKLKLYTDKPYYIGLLSYFYNVPKNSLLDTKEELIDIIKFTFLGNWNITTVEPSFEIVFTGNSIKDSSGNKIKQTTKKINGYSFPNGDKGLYEICVGY